MAYYAITWLVAVGLGWVVIHVLLGQEMNPGFFIGLTGYMAWDIYRDRLRGAR